MIRVVFLLTTGSRKQREAFIKASLAGEKWSVVNTKTGKKQPITDRDMVGRAKKLRHWTESVYRFGCAFMAAPENGNGSAEDEQLTNDRLRANRPAIVHADALTRRFHSETFVETARASFALGGKEI